MKRLLSILLAVMMLLSLLSGCKSGGGGGTETPTPAPATPASTGGGSGGESAKPAFQSYEYSYGAMTIGVPWNLPAEPKDDGDSVVFSDPESQWTVRFTPLGVSDTGYKEANLANLMESFRTMGNYQNIDVASTTLDGFEASYFAFEMNPDWDDARQGYTLSYHEPHALYVLNYGDKVIGSWGGLLIDIAAPEKARVDLGPIIEDEDVQTLLNNITFRESDGMVPVSIPGLTVSFPARWVPGSDNDHTIWAGIRGSVKGSVYFGSSVYADPQQAAGYLDSSQTMEFAGRKWYGGIRTSELSDSTMKGLELFTDFTEYHSLYARVNLSEWQSDQDFWDFVNDDLFRSVMESVQTDPASFHNPEDDRRDKSGFECNTINEISAYAGTEKDLVIPAAIGETEIVGINYAVFKDNTNLTSVTLSEGISYIDSQAFRGCTKLKTVVLPSSLVLIDSKAFEGCTALESVTFGDNLIEIGSSAFENCTSLKDVILPDTVQSIGSTAFSKTGTGSGRFVCPAEGTWYGGMALADCKYDSVVIGPAADLTEYNILQNYEGRSLTIGEGTTAVGDYFLFGLSGDTKLTEFNLPTSLTTIGKNAFSGRMGLTSYDFTTVENMGEGAFEETGLTQIVVPGTMKVVPDSAFAYCPNVESVTICEGVEVIEEDAFCSVGRKGKTTDTYNFLSDADVQQYRNVVHVNDPAYQKFFEIVLPSTIKEIQEDAFLSMHLEGLYLPWLESMDQLPEVFMPCFENYECIYVPEETYNKLGSALQEYFLQDDCFEYWAGSVRVFDGRYHYWTDQELGLDA